MVRQCQVCKKLDYLNPDLSFRKFPSDNERRKIWLSLLGLDENPRLPKFPTLCSDHFDASNIITKANGSKCIKPDANPLPCHSAFEFVSDSSDSTLYDSPTKRSRTEDICLEELVALPVNISPPTERQSEASSVAKEDKDQTESRMPSSSSLTATASEAEKEILNLTLTEQNMRQGPLKLLSKKRKRRYVGDLTSSDFSTPEKRRRNLGTLKNTVGQQRRKIHNLQSTVRRLRLRITSLKSLLTYLREQSLISEASECTISASISGTAGDLFKRLLKGPSKQKYNPSLRTFALTLSFYSPKAYNFVRKTFNRSLPHLGTISKWYRSIDGSPGFTKEALIALSLKQKDSSTPLLCNLVMDEMSIRRQVEWTGHKFTGYVDIGTNLESDVLPEAREALVFMLVCINGSWKIPIGYFLLDGLAAIEKAELVKKCLEFINESGIVVTSLTFDGAPINISMAEKLGADFSNPFNLKTCFKNPVTNTDIYICLDACHMIKLVRNCFASQSGLKDKNRRDVKWSFISNLVEKQYTEGLHAATKVRMRHLQWAREKMKVRLATQTLSRSVSDAINFLREDLKSPDFQGSEATTEFILNFNNLFDILNSRNIFAKYLYKKPLSPKTAEHFLNFMEEMKIYITGLTLDGISVLKSARKTGFLGLLIDIESLKKIYNIYVLEKKILKYVLSYKLSQDHLELFFGAIRSKGGYNNNPTARQFEAAYKRLLVHSEIAASDTGNVVNLEMITILTCGSGKKIVTSANGTNLEENEKYLASTLQEFQSDLEEHDYLGSAAWNLTPYVEDIVGYISGFVIKGLKRCITCLKCLNLLESDLTPSLLQEKKTYGKLVKSSQMVVEICKAGEKYFRLFHKTTNIFNKNITKLYDTLTNNTIKKLPISVFDHFGDHLYDEDPIDGHSIQLIKLVLKSYFKLRIHHETTKNLDLSRQNRSRSINTKTILFRNE